MGSKTQTSTSQQSTTPTNLAGLQSIFGQVQNAAQTPFTPYTGELTAPVNAQQQAGISGVNSAAGSAQPYYDRAANYAATGASPLTAAAIQGYSNPFTQSVIDATQQQFNESNGQQQQQVKGSAAMAGALGGDRQAVAQSEVARQQQLAQAPVIAGLNQQNYQQALQAAQADRSAAGNAAGTFGNLGTAAQQAALQGAGAQINAGTLQQSTLQQSDQAAYQQYLQKQGFPYQQAAFFAQNGLPAAVAQGSSTSGSQTSPGPSVLGQLAGLGIAGASIMSGNPFGAISGLSSAFGGGSTPTGATFGGYSPGNTSGFGSYGGVSYPAFADGGSVPSSPYSMSGYITDPGFITAPGYVPQGHAPAAQPLSAPHLTFAPAQQQSPLAPAIDALKAIKRKPSSDSSFADGGLVDAIHSIHRAIKHSRVGAVDSSPFQPFAKGGSVRGFADGGSPFADRFDAISDAPEAAPEPFRLAGPEAMDAWRKGVDQPNPALIADTEASSMRAASLPPQITGAPQDDSEPGSALAFDRTPAMGGPPSNPYAPSDAAIAARNDASPASSSPFNLNDKQRQALLVTGLGMLASRSPFAGVALGEGALKGAGAYSEATVAEQAAADKKVTQGQAQQSIDLRAKEMVQKAENYNRSQRETERSNRASEAKDYAAKLVTQVDPNSGETSYLTFDPKTKQLMPAAAPGASGGAAPKFESTAAPIAERRKAPAASPQARDDSYYDYMSAHRPPGYADVVKAVADYEIDPNREASLQKGARDRLYRDVKMYDPTYDQTHFAEKSGVIQNFSRGPASQAVNSLNVSVAHLGTLAQLGEALQNGNSPAINKIANAIAVQLGKPAPTNFDAAKEIVGDEVVKAVVGGVNSQADREAIKHLILSQQTPAQLNGVIKTFTALLGGQLDGQRQRYQAGTGLNNFDQKYLAPETREALKSTSDGKIDPAIARAVYPSGIPKEAGSGAPAAPAAGPVPVTPKSIPTGSAYSPSRKQWKAPDGTIYNSDGSKA